TVLHLGPKCTSGAQRLQRVVHEEGRPHERLENGDHVLAESVRLLPEPDQGTDEPEPVDGTAGRRAGRSLASPIGHVSSPAEVVGPTLPAGTGARPAQDARRSPTASA